MTLCAGGDDDLFLAVVETCRVLTRGIELSIHVRVDIAEPDVYEFIAIGEPDSDLMLDLFALSRIPGQPASDSIAGDDDSFGNLNPLIRATLSPGTYDLVVSGYALCSAGPLHTPRTKSPEGSLGGIPESLQGQPLPQLFGRG